MDVLIKHEGTTVTDQVVSYEREHRICTGVGTLRIVFERTTPEDFAPGDTIDIHENGSFQVRYYVSGISDSIPEGTVTLDCQDKSKYLVDFFIPQSYTIDYPSYTRTWIELFLDMADISYSFLTSSQGQLLSNFTQLGLASGYDQVMQLLQLSGWYMYFDGNGVAKIGALQTDLSGSDGSITEEEILSLSRNEDDKMLRNRAVVWGAFDVVRQQHSYADVTIQTRWNYDANDLRTMVISNSNIPTKGSAFKIANTLLKEFTRLTVEKHISIPGVMEMELGETLKVKSRVWSGKGLITTYGTSMSRDGLVTNVVLDERCPRLFGFFDFGDYVYVATFGDGVWRKHIKFDPTWYNFSSGLTNLNITDLHINNGVFGSVGHSGQMYFADSEDGPWIPFAVDSLVSSGWSIEEPEMNFSGIMARATIVDRRYNTVKWGVDTWSGLNTGDYYIDLSGWMITYSGAALSGYYDAIASGIIPSGYRGWIIEHDINNPVDSYEYYPINVSGDYNIRIIDLENDGYNDYVSVAMVEPGVIEHTITGYNFGYQTYQTVTQVGDTNAIVSVSVEQFNLEGQTLAGTVTTAPNKVISIFDDESIGESDIVWHESGGGISVFKRNHFSKEFNEILGRDEVISTTTTSPSQIGTDLGLVECLSKVTIGIYKIFHSSVLVGTPDTDYEYTIKVRTWNSLLNTVTSDTTLGTFIVAHDTNKPSTSEFFDYSTIVVNGIIYNYVIHLGDTSSGGNPPNTENYTSIHRMTVDTSTNAFSSGLITRIDFEESEGGLGQIWNTFSLTGGLPLPKYLFQKGNGVSLSFVIREWNQLSAPSATILRNWLISSEDGTTFEKTEIENTTTSTDPDFLLNSGTSESTSGGSQLTTANHLLYHRNASTGNTYIFNGEVLAKTNYPFDAPYYWKASKIYPMFGVYTDKYLVLDSGTWYFCNSNSLIPVTEMSFPINYSINAPYLTTDSITPQYYWLATNNDTSEQEILITGTSTIIRTIIPFNVPGSSFLDRGYIVGNFFINYKPGTGAVRYIYLDNDTNIPGAGTRFLVLQRDGLEYNIVQEAGFPIRVEISNNAPLLTVQHQESTFNSFYISGNEVTQVSLAPSGIIPASGMEVYDYRYTLLEEDTGIDFSGIMMQALALEMSGIYITDVATLSGFMLWDEIPSGIANRIETSNYVPSGQFVFVTTSGEQPNFYQRDAGSLFFDAYSGLPNSRATIIRADDRF